jgi:hypothetical protein
MRQYQQAYRKRWSDAPAAMFDPPQREGAQAHEPG